MADVDWRFPALLIGAMLLGIVLTYFQQQAYKKELNRALGQGKGDHLMLVSGRGRSWRGGAIAILIVDTLTQQITWASVMRGRTAFARFRERPELLGPVEGAPERAEKPIVAEALTMALAQVRTAPTDNPPASEVRPRRPSGTARPSAKARPRPVNPERK
ncbi:MAG: transcriptional regulator GutM [Propioniciclava sp.]